MIRRAARRRGRICSLLGAALLLALSALGSELHSQVSHPMDALTYPEVRETVRLVREAGLSDERTLYPVITLKEMAKKDVLSWQPGHPVTRKALVVMHNPGNTRRVIVDLDRKLVGPASELPGVQPSIMQRDWDRASAVVKDDERWRDAMRRRGHDDFSAITMRARLCRVLFFAEGFADRRILKVPCYQSVTRAGRTHPNWSRPVEGVIAIVDVDREQVIDVIDTDPVIPAGHMPGHGLGPVPTPDLPKPVEVTSPQGPNLHDQGCHSGGLAQLVVSPAGRPARRHDRVTCALRRCRRAKADCLPDGTGGTCSYRTWIRTRAGASSRSSMRANTALDISPRRLSPAATARGMRPI